MKNDNVKYKIGLGLILFMMFFSFFSFVSAQTPPASGNTGAGAGAVPVGGSVDAGEYTVLAPLPGTTIGNNGKTTNLNTYLPNLFNLMVGMAAVLAFVVIVWGGFTYATTDSFFGKDEGKKQITNAVWGLVLVIGAWVILYTINPQILNFDLILPKPKVQTVTGGSACPNCTTFETSSIPTSGGAVGRSADSSMIGKLITLNQKIKLGALPEGGSWYVTEGHPPTHTHQSACHNNGGCVDANISKPTIKNIEAFLKSAKSVGIGASYEVTSVQQLEALAKEAKVRIIVNHFEFPNGGTVVLNTKASGPHFHLK